MDSNADHTADQTKGEVFELRALTNRWIEPMEGTVISSHSSAKAAWAAFERQPKAGSEGGGRSTYGNFQPTAVVRVGADGSESMVLAPPMGNGLLNWPYPNTN